MCEYRYLKANYESTVDWHTAEDYLRCSPSFHGHLWQDFVIVQRPEGQIMFAQILLVFKFTFANVEYSLALVQPYNKPIASHSRPKKDCDLGFLQVRSAAHTSSDFIFVDSIVRGALLVDA
jgi:hypothetical protein